MWTEEKIKEAADRYACDVAVNNALNDEVYCYLDVKDAFLAGAKFMINNAQKENESIS